MERRRVTEGRRMKKGERERVEKQRERERCKDGRGRGRGRKRERESPIFLTVVYFSDLETHQNLSPINFGEQR